MNSSQTQLPSEINKSPDPRRVRDRRARLKGWRRKVYDYLVVPAEVPSKFTEPLRELADKLRTSDPTTASTALLEATAILQEATDRIESAERRATTLQGTVAIAASIVIAGAGFLLDRTKIDGGDWRILFAVLLAAFVGCLIGCAWRALSVTGRMFEYEEGGDRIFLRAQEEGIAAQALLAAERLRSAGVASEVGSVKVGLLRAAAWWLRLGLLVLAVLAAVFAIYVGTASSERPLLAQKHSKRG